MKIFCWEKTGKCFFLISYPGHIKWNNRNGFSLYYAYDIGVYGNIVEHSRSLHRKHRVESTIFKVDKSLSFSNGTQSKWHRKKCVSVYEEWCEKERKKRGKNILISSLLVRSVSVFAWDAKVCIKLTSFRKPWVSLILYTFNILSSILIPHLHRLRNVQMFNYPSYAFHFILVYSFLSKYIGFS